MGTCQKGTGAKPKKFLIIKNGTIWLKKKKVLDYNHGIKEKCIGL